MFRALGIVNVGDFREALLRSEPEPPLLNPALTLKSHLQGVCRPGQAPRSDHGFAKPLPRRQLPKPCRVPPEALSQPPFTGNGRAAAQLQRHSLCRAVPNARQQARLRPVQYRPRV